MRRVITIMSYPRNKAPRVSLKLIRRRAARSKFCVSSIARAVAFIALYLLSLSKVQFKL
jgi:hypothetical protein